jgi:hypothetical protein
VIVNFVMSIKENQTEVSVPKHVFLFKFDELIDLRIIIRVIK